jgi:hypothetical protein
LTGVGDGDGRRAAFTPSSATDPIAAMPPMPRSPFKTVLRFAPEASALVIESKRLSSMAGCPREARHNARQFNCVWPQNT